MSGTDPVEIFRSEALELLEKLESALLDLEQAPENRELVDDAFRALHTIKGSGAMFGFEAVAAFTHHVESAFDQLRKGQLPATPPLIALALAAQDHIRTMIGQPEEDHTARSGSLLAELAALLGRPGNSLASAAAAAESGDKQERWRVIFRLARDAMAMGTNPLLLLDELRGLGRHCTVTALTGEVPSLDELEPESCYLGWQVVLTTAAPRSAIEDVFIFVIDDAELTIDSIELSDEARIGEILVARGVPRQTVEEIAAARPPLGELLVQAGKVSSETLRSALAEQRHIVQEHAVEMGGRDVAKANASIRVPAERLDDLVDRVGELVIVQARLKQLAAAGGDPQIKAVAEEMERLSAELRDTTMSIRMVPIGILFGRFRRLVHDLSRDLGKKVRLVTTGEETELDKTVIERLNDPLVHMIRNAIDHAIETPEERLAVGKPAEGELHLHAWHAGAQVAVSVQDDGRGFDRDRILAKAVENGLVTADARLGDDEIYQLVFQPGFSTAREVTSVSGRGVGMDVVRRAIDALRGTIEIANTPGQGAMVTVRLPLTLAIIDGLLVRVGRGRYVIPLSAVEECVALSSKDDQAHSGRDFLNIRGDLVPFLRLRDMFRTTVPADPYQKVVIVSTGERRIGLVVDQVLGDHQTVIKSLSKLHADVQTFSGATILGDGTVALIFDISHLIAAYKGDEARPMAL